MCPEALKGASKNRGGLTAAKISKLSYQPESVSSKWECREINYFTTSMTYLEVKNGRH